MRPARSQILDLIRVIAIFFVMVGHSPISEDLKQHSVIFFLTDFLANGAVPAFFMLSGYLGARKIDDQQVSFGAYIREKVHTLVIPFLFWNGLLLSLVLVAKHFGLEALRRGESGGYFEVEPNFSSIASALFGIGRNPIVYQFWFLRDLIIISPISFLICRHFPRIPLLPWLLFLIPLQVVGSMGFFLLGYSLKGYAPTALSLTPRAMGRYCAVWILCGYGLVCGWTSIPYPFQKLGSAIFLLFLAQLFTGSKIGQWLAGFAGATFLIYAMHQPTQSIIAKIWQSLNWGCDGSLFAFFLIPILVFPMGVLLHSFLQQRRSCLLPYLTGGR